jgi:hypothetical protein
MFTMTKSVKTYPNANIESMAEAGLSLSPHEMVCALEEAFAANFLKPQPFIQLAPKVPLNELIANDPVMGTMAEQLSEFAQSRVLANAKWQQKLMIFRNFGKWGLEKDERALIDKSKEGLESVEDRLAVVCHAIESVKSRKAWKAEQNRAQNPLQCRDMCRTYDLPPRTKGKSHQPAYYSFKSPKGVKIDLFEPQGYLKPKLCTNPSQAFQAFMKRRGLNIKGGDTHILNRIMDAPMIEIENENGVIEKCYKWLPSYVTTNCGAWFVSVGWRLNPKCSSGEFHRVTPQGEHIAPFVENADGELERYNPAYHAKEDILSASKLDYHLLSESSELAVQDETGEVVDFMNEEEEFLTCFPQREDDQVFIDLSKFAEDDDEIELFRAVSSVIERSESGITMGDAQSKAFTEEYLHEGIESAKETIERCMKVEPNEQTEQIIEWMQEKIERLTRLTKLQNAFCTESSSQGVSRYWYPQTHNMWTMGRSKNYAKEPVKTLTCMTKAPDGDIEPETTFIMSPTRYINRKVISCTLDDAKQLRRRKTVENSITHNRFGMLIREKTAAKEFASTLDALLS